MCYWLVRYTRDTPALRTSFTPNTAIGHGKSRYFPEWYEMSATRGHAFPEKLYPAVKSLPVRSVEVPIWPDIPSGNTGESK